LKEVKIKMELWKKLEKEVEVEKMEKGDIQCIIEKLKEMGYCENDIKTGRVELKDIDTAMESCEIKLKIPIKQLQEKLTMSIK